MFIDAFLIKQKSPSRRRQVESHPPASALLLQQSCMSWRSDRESLVVELFTWRTWRWHVRDEFPAQDPVLQPRRHRRHHVHDEFGAEARQIICLKNVKQYRNNSKL